MDQPPSTTEASTHVEEISTKYIKNVWLDLLKIATSSNPNLQGGGCIFASIAKLARICFESKCPPKHPMYHHHHYCSSVPKMCERRPCANLGAQTLDQATYKPCSTLKRKYHARTQDLKASNGGMTHEYFIL